MQRMPQFFYKEISAGGKETFTKPFDVWVIECEEDTELKLNDSALPMNLKQDDVLVSVGIPLNKLFIQTGKVKLVATRIGVRTDRPLFTLTRNIGLTTTAEAVANGLNTYGTAKDSSIQSILAQLDVALSTRASEATLSAIKNALDVALSTRASESTLNSINGKIAKCDTDNVNLVSERAWDSVADLKKMSIERDNVGLATENTLSSIDGKITKCDTDNVNLAAPPNAKLENADETSPQNVDLDTKAFKNISIYATATTATTFHVYASVDNSTWFEIKNYSNVTEVNDNFNCAFRYIRVTWDGAGTSGTDAVSIYISAKP